LTVAPWTNYRVVAEFREPLILGGLAGITGFAWQLVDALGMYSGVTTLWEPAQVDGTGIAYIDTRTIFVNVTIPVLDPLSLLEEHRAIFSPAAAEDAVRRALGQLGYDAEIVHLAAARIGAGDAEPPAS
jgi:hypothetical protein